MFLRFLRPSLWSPICLQQSIQKSALRPLWDSLQQQGPSAQHLMLPVLPLIPASVLPGGQRAPGQGTKLGRGTQAPFPPALPCCFLRNWSLETLPTEARWKAATRRSQGDTRGTALVCKTQKHLDKQAQREAFLLKPLAQRQLHSGQVKPASKARSFHSISCPPTHKAGA